MTDWNLLECIIVIGIGVSLMLASYIATEIIYFFRQKRYEKPAKRLSPRDWKSQEDDWDERIMKG